MSRSLLFTVILLIMVNTFCGCIINTDSTSESVMKTESELFEDKNISQDRNIEILYPKIVDGINGNGDKINQIIKETAINNYQENWTLSGLNLIQTYSIELQNDKIISIVFSGSPYVTGTAHPTDICFAVSISLKNSEIYNLKSFIDSYEIFEKKIKENDYDILYGSLKVYTPEELLVIFKEKYEKKPLEEHINDFYINESGDICIIIDDLPHAEGDYSIICFKGFNLE